jgi:hypothetical protein
MIFRKKSAPATPEAASKATAQTPRPEWDLRTMTQRLNELTPVLETKDIEPPLVEARLADCYRELDREPVPQQQFERLVGGLDPDAWRRLALAVGALDHPDIRSALARLTTTAVEQVTAGFVGTATATDALTLAMLRQSDVRVEEFARHLADRLGIFWQGESAEQSKKRLQQLDYKRLMAEAEEARKQAEQRMEYLRKKQEEELARRRRRGKQ